VNNKKKTEKNPPNIFTAVVDRRHVFEEGVIGAIIPPHIMSLYSPLKHPTLRR